MGSFDKNTIQIFRLCLLAELMPSLFYVITDIALLKKPLPKAIMLGFAEMSDHECGDAVNMF